MSWRKNAMLTYPFHPSPRTDYDLFSPALIAPLFLPLPLSLAALVCLSLPPPLHAPSRPALLAISRALRAHVLLQGIIALTIWETLGETAIYHRGADVGGGVRRPAAHSHPHAHAAHTTRVGSASQRLAFTMVSIAQAGLPLVFGLSSQWAVASRLARLGGAGKREAGAGAKADRDGNDVGDERKGTTSPRQSSPSFLLPFAGDCSHDKSMMGLATTVGTPSAHHAAPRPRTISRHLHRSRRPSTAAAATAAAGNDYAHTSTSPSPPTLRSSPEPLHDARPYRHQRSQSQPVLAPFEHASPWTASEAMATELENLLARGVRQGLIQPRRAHTDGSRAAA